MCGIVGWTNPRGLPVTQFAGLDRALSSLRHRGPDDSGQLWLGADGFIDPAIDIIDSATSIRLALGHTRLSIIDLSKAGRQPLVSPDNRYCLSFNGEIYNYLELRESLIALGHQFVSSSDTEVLLHAYMEWGSACLDKLVGMFAFAIFDRQRQSLFLARDPFGIKPLYYYCGDNNLGFASELAAFSTLPGFNAALNHQKAFDYLVYGALDSDEATLYQGVMQLPPAGSLTYELSSHRLIHHPVFWKIDPTSRCGLSFDEAAARLREMLLASVELHMRSDVAVGAALSGGIDSSIIVSAIRALYPAQEIHTFSYISESASLSEEKWVDRVASHNGCHVHKTTLDPEQLTADLQQLIKVQGEPFGSTSIYAQLGVFRLASEAGIKVSLDGQGADELFAGYDSYQGYRLASLLAGGQLPAALSFARASASWPNRNQRQNIQRALYTLAPAALVPLGRAMIGKSELPGWLDKQWVQDRGIDVRAIAARPPVIDGQHLKSQQFNQIEGFGLAGLLRYADRSAMSFSIESRVPFLTRELADFAFSLPEHYLIDSQGCSKAVLRAAMKDIVPQDVLYRKDKIGFATDQGAWLKQLKPWVDQTLQTASAVSFLDQDKISGLWNSSASKSLSPQVWRWVNFLQWASVNKLEM